MKAIVVNEAGGTDKLIYQEVDLPKVKANWSLIKIKGFGINRSEIFTREGESPTVLFPRVLGIECVGVIEETNDSEKLPKGQKVLSIMGEMGRAFDGSYAEYVAVPNDQIYPVTTNLPWKELATIPETYYTAFGSMKNLKIIKGDRILVRGATSGVGISFLKLLKARYPNLTIDGTSRSQEKKELLLSAGFNAVIIDKNGKLETEQKYDKILELIGPATVKDSFKHLNEGGILCSTGQLGGKWFLEKFDPIIDIAKNSYLTSFYSDNVSENKLNELLDYISKYKVDVKPEKIFKLSEVPLAHDYLQNQNSFGKVIVLLTGE